MKLVCIDIKDYVNITLGKSYNLTPLLISKLDNSIYWIKDDSGNVRGIDKKCFITLEEWRNNKIESIL